MTDAEYADLIKKYGEEVVLNAYEDFDRHLNNRKKSLEALHHEKARQDRNFAEINKLFGTKKSYDFTIPLKEHNQKFDADELNIAKDNGAPEPGKEKLSKEEKLARAKENFKEEAKKSDEPERKPELDIDKKQKKFLEAIEKVKEKNVSKETEKKAAQSWLVENKEKDAEKKIAFEESRDNTIKNDEASEASRKAEERARIIAEIKAAQERNHSVDRER